MTPDRGFIFFRHFSSKLLKVNSISSSNWVNFQLVFKFAYDRLNKNCSASSKYIVSSTAYLRYTVNHLLLELSWNIALELSWY